MRKSQSFQSKSFPQRVHFPVKPSEFVVCSPPADRWTLSGAAGLKTFPRDCGMAFLQICSGKPCMCQLLSHSQQFVHCSPALMPLPTGGAFHLLTVPSHRDSSAVKLSHCIPPARNPEPSLCRRPASTYNAEGMGIPCSHRMVRM